MIQGHSTTLGAQLQAYLRPSRLLAAAWCVFWGAIALLHVYFFARRIMIGDFASGFGLVRLLMALAGAIYCIYGAQRVGNVALLLERSPRKVFCVILLLILGHLFIKPSVNEAAGSFLSSDAGPQAVLVIPALMAAVVFAVGLIAIAFRASRRPQLRYISIRQTRTLAPKQHTLSPQLLQRPPPRK